MTDPNPNSVPFDQRKCTAEERAVFLIIQAAQLEMAPKTLHFTYTDAKGVETERHAEPYSVVGGAEAQLFAWDRDKEATRRFKLGKMADVRPGEVFTPRFEVKITLG